jgi:hypothetical protein
LDPILRHVFRYVPKQLRLRSVIPHQLKHLRLAVGELGFELPLALALHMGMWRVMIVRPKPARKARYLEASDLGHGSPATAESRLDDRTFFNGDKNKKCPVKEKREVWLCE